MYMYLYIYICVCVCVCVYITYFTKNNPMIRVLPLSHKRLGQHLALDTIIRLGNNNNNMNHDTFIPNLKHNHKY